MEQDANKRPMPSLDQLASLNPKVSDDDIMADAVDQLTVLMEHLCDTWMSNISDGGKVIDLHQILPAYQGQERELYDSLVAIINKEHKKRKDPVRYPRVGNIFNELSGLSLQDRKCVAPIGTIIYEPVGKIETDGLFHTYAPGQPASSGLNRSQATMSKKTAY